MRQHKSDSQLGSSYSYTSYTSYTSTSHSNHSNNTSTSTNTTIDPQPQPTSLSKIPLTFPAFRPTVSKSEFPSTFSALSGNELIAFLHGYCDMGFPNDSKSILTIVREIGRFWAWGDRYLPLTRSADPLKYGTPKSKAYALATCFPKAKSVNDTTGPDVKILNEILRDVTFYMPNGVQKIRCVVLGRLLMDNMPTYFIIVMDAEGILYALRGDDVDEQDIEFCLGDAYDLSRNKYGDHVCSWKADRAEAVFGDFENLRAVKLGRVSSFVDAQIRGDLTWVIEPMWIFRWSSVLVPGVEGVDDIL